MHAAQLLLLASVAIVGALGAIQIVYTFHGNRLAPRDAAVRQAMERCHPVITRQTTVWRATQGFNASHGLGMVVFGLVYGYLVLLRLEVLAGSWFLLALGMSALLCYLVLAHRFFFSIPFRGMALASSLFAGGWWLS
jgi:hypothetical protein